jgi:nitrite reductase/ring-hydroxylating ferredoxin subunit
MNQKVLGLIADLADLPPGSAREVRIGGHVYDLFRLGDSVHCLDGLCPHGGTRLATAGRAEAVVACPLVGCLRWRFDIRTGACLQHGRIRLRTYEVRIAGGAVLLAAGRLSDAEGAGTAAGGHDRQRGQLPAGPADERGVLNDQGGGDLPPYGSIAPPCPGAPALRADLSTVNGR